MTREMVLALMRAMAKEDEPGVAQALLDLIELLAHGRCRSSGRVRDADAADAEMKSPALGGACGALD